MAEKAKSSVTDAAVDFEGEMATARDVMERNWVVLRALALGDQHPELDVETRMEMAREQAARPNP